MPHPVPLTSADPRRIGRYRLTARLEGIPSDDPIYIGIGPDETHVAITALGGDWSLDAAARDRFAEEAAVAKRVPPFCAARVLDAGLDGAQAYLVSEYVYGESLLELVSAEGVRRGHDLEAVAIGMATGLASVHQAGLVHGNFGPEFVIMAPDGAPRIVEFGITPPYGAATPSADMLSWAQTVAFAASGHPPASLDDLDVLPEHIRDPVARCLDPEPGARLPARAVVQSLLGTADLPAGLLAEGSRRAVRTARTAHGHAHVSQAYGGPGHGGSGYAGISHSGPHERPARTAAARWQERPADDADDWPAGDDTGPGPSVRHSHPGARRRTRRSGWLIGAAVVVLIAAGALATHALLANGSSRASSGQLSADTGATSKTPSSSASVSPSHDVITPAAFAGAWSGIVRQPPSDTYYVNVTFSTGTSAGTVSYAGTGFSCSGALTLTQATSEQLILSQGIIHGQSSCENGQVTITLTGSGKVIFSFRSNGPVASGTLTRQAGG
jgi:eukaryotic-like serine/threonine-protein kinase